MITHMKDKTIEFVTHSIEVLEGERHGERIENKKLSANRQKLEK